VQRSEFKVQSGETKSLCSLNSELPSTLSVLIPVYNEQSFLSRIVERVLAAPVPGNMKKELVIVNDASTDRTSNVIQDLCARHPEIRVFDQPYNQGKGAAIRRAIKEMSGQYAIIQDADLEYDPNDYMAVLQPLVHGLADAVYGSRYASREMRRIVHYHHKLGNLFLTHLSNWATGLDLTDMETCYKAFRAELLKSIPLQSNRFGIEPEITAKLAKRGAVIYEVPISYHGRRYDEGKKIGWKDGVSAIWTIFKYRLIDDCYEPEADTPKRQMMAYARNYTQWVGQMVRSRCGERILELGAGDGNVSRFLPQREKLVVADDNPRHVMVLQNQFDGNQTVDVVHLDVTFPDAVSKFSQNNQFDTIVYLDQLAKSEDERAILENIRHLMTPDGKLILTVPLGKWLFGSVDQSVGRVKRYCKREILALLEQSGYRILEYRSFNALAVPGLLINSKIVRSQKLGKLQLKLYHTFVPLFARFERILPLPRANAFIVASPKS